jgi:hypothetical protein
MGYLLDLMTPKTVDLQRDVVKNERRQSVENQPYGEAQVVLGEMLYPEGHPYHWPVIGYMDDLTAASYDDVVAFFKKYYAPANASLVVAGDLETRGAADREVTRRREAGRRPEPITIPGVALRGREDHRDRVQLPLFLAWLTPRHFGRATCARHGGRCPAGGKNSRLFKGSSTTCRRRMSARSGVAGVVLVVQDRRRRGRSHRGRAAEVIDEESEAQREPPTATNWSARSTRSSRRSTTAWSASAASAAKPIS